MVEISTPHRRTLESWSPRLFLIGGGFVAGHATIRGIQAFTNMATPVDVFGPVGYLLAVLGLFGLYPSIADRTPRLARVAAIVAVIPFVGWTVISATSFGQIIGILHPQSEILPGVFFLGHFVGMILTYGLFGVAALRTDERSRIVGILLLVPPVLFVMMIVGAAMLGNSELGAFVIGSGLSLTHVGIGYTLHTDPDPSDHETPAGDATVG